MVAFIWYERNQPEPIIDLKFFKDRVFTFAIIASFISFMGMIGGFFLIPLFVQTYLGYSVTKSGYLFIPMAFGIMVSAQMGGRLVGKFPGNILTALGLFWTSGVMFVLTGIDIKWGFWHIAGLLFLLALGLGVGFAALTQAATSRVPLHEVGIASSILALARNIAGAFGVAIFATILTNSTYGQMENIQRFSSVNTYDPTLLQTIAGLMEVKANVAAYSSVFFWSGIITVLGGFAALLVTDSRSKNAQPLSPEHQAIEI